MSELSVIAKGETPSRDNRVAAVIAIAAAYVYFLIFSEFAFIEIIRAQLGDEPVRKLMAALGAGGIIGSLLAARHFSSRPHARMLTAGFAACAITAGLTLTATGVTGFAVTATLGGLGLGWTTVTLVLHLSPTTNGRLLGLCCGLGTGIAYTLCNLPSVFTATPEAQVEIAVVAAIIGGLASLRMTSAPAAVSVAPKHDRALWIALFFVLVWLDSAAFFIIQHSPAIKSATWQGSGALIVNAITHLGSAIFAGWLLDREHRLCTVAAASVLLVVACSLLQSAVGHGVVIRTLYTVGVSFYSTALVFIPANHGRAWFAGLLYAIAGWVGSALGIGMAQDLQKIPAWFLAAACLPMLLAITGNALRTKNAPSSN